MFAKVACKTTSTNGVDRSKRAFSLMELMVAMLIATVAGSGILLLSVYTSRSVVDMVNYVDLDHGNRIALDRMSKELRQVKQLTTFTSTSLTFVDKDGTPLRYDYSPLQRTLTRVKDDIPTTVLEQCENLKFAMYQRTPLANRYELIPATSPAQCKVITVTWNCSRTVLGIKANTEQGQTAKIVIRNKKEI
jgi:prepilin-type N-terminal cleavage/methylation domain-containing protein